MHAAAGSIDQVGQQQVVTFVATFPFYWFIWNVTLLSAVQKVSMAALSEINLKCYSFKL